MGLIVTADLGHVQTDTQCIDVPSSVLESCYSVMSTQPNLNLTKYLQQWSLECLSVLQGITKATKGTARDSEPIYHRLT
jgi:hypothetical protein